MRKKELGIVRNIDTSKLADHPERVTEWRKTGFVYPLQVEIGLTNDCNHNCWYCSLNWAVKRKEKPDHISRNALVPALRDMGRVGVKAIYFGGEGENLLHPDFVEFVRTARLARMGVAFTSNAELFDEKLARLALPYLTWFRIGIDANTPRTYSQIHRIHPDTLKTVFKNIETAVRINEQENREVDIGVQYILLEQNVDEAVDFAKRMKKIGVNNVQFKPFAQHVKAIQRNIDYSQSKFRDLEDELTSLSDDKFTVVYRKKTMEQEADLRKGRAYDGCPGLNFWTLIDAQGNVLPCNLFYEQPGSKPKPITIARKKYDPSNFYFGNINNQTFSEIWRGDKRKQVMKLIAESDHTMCGNYKCRPHVINIDAQEYLDPPKGSEFI